MDPFLRSAATEAHSSSGRVHGRVIPVILGDEDERACLVTRASLPAAEVARSLQGGDDDQKQRQDKK